MGFFQISIGFADPSEMTEVVLEHNKSNDQNIKKLRTIVDSASDEQSVAKYQKLGEIFASPTPNQLVLLRGKLVQSLNGKDLFVFQDDNIISNMLISPNLWEQINSKDYILNKNIQFLAKVSINQENQSIYLQTIRIFANYSNTESYVLTNEDKELSDSLNKKIAMNYKNQFKLAADTKSAENNAETAPPAADDTENFDSVDEEETSKATNNPYIESFKQKELIAPQKNNNTPAPQENTDDEKSNAETAIVKEDSQETTANDKLDTNPIEPKPEVSEEASPEKDVNQENEVTPEETYTEENYHETPVPEEVKNKVPNEKILQTKGQAHENYNVIQPEEIERSKKNDNISEDAPRPAKKSWFRR